MTEQSEEQRPVRITVLRANGTTDSFVIGEKNTPMVYLTKEEFIAQGTDIDVLGLLVSALANVVGMKQAHTEEVSH
ncbi:MAG: hypothetical protein ACWGQW_00905 [bacterium]